ncbi:MAG TPA: DUF4412 domain-containing protein [Verrucomicrobiae bacterium]|nr:DUF4412 domain-containing protein [Verrucomicrobiae bacterium]
MCPKIKLALVALLLPALFSITQQFSTAFAFEGRITATVTRGGQIQTLLYTVGTNQLRIERGENDHPYPKNIVDHDTGDLTLLFPHNRSFVRLKAGAENQSPAPPGFPGMPNRPPMPEMPVPPGAIGPTNLPGMPAPPQMPQMPPGVGPQAGSSVPNMPAMPMMMPPMPMEGVELKATTETTNLLGYACTRYELRQRGEVMEIWATDKLMTFEPYVQNQPHRFGPRMIEQQWGGLLKAKKLFPLLAVLRLEPPPGPTGVAPAPPGPERLRFEVQSITPEKINDETLFQPPPDYQEIQPLPF